MRGYITLFTGTPLLVQIFLIYYGPGQFPSLQDYPWLWHLISEPWLCALIALSLTAPPTPLSYFMAPSGRSPTGNGSPAARWG
ncbi:Arginine ABC transporter [Klebsiella pneumoniae]|uniref:Arginine ABC transporter n=1 Tax=Klebsiella pneumoniae TaxID=573 RepID=A0A378BF76_KLEPN|nr:Arginine ABC transporter [Klebsiella pneumoniae]